MDQVQHQWMGGDGVTFEPWPIVGGPILAWELKRHARMRVYLCRGLYAAWLFVLTAAWFQEVASQERRAIARLEADASFAGRMTARGRVVTRESAEFFSFLLRQQLILLLAATPAFTAGTITREKERRTFEYLLTTDVSGREIVAGKFLGRIVLVAGLALVGLPLLVCLGYLGGIEWTRLLAALVQAGVILFAVGSAGMLTSALTKRTQDALLACYSLGVLAFMGLLVIRDHFALPIWLGPFDILNRLLTEADPWERFGIHVTAWAVLGLVCLGLALWRVRATALNQIEGKERLKKLLRDSRPAVGDDPVRWKERYVVGIAPLPWLRTIPRWFGMLSVLSFSLVLNGFALTAASPPWERAAFKQGDWSALPRMFRDAEPGAVVFELFWIGLVLVALSSLTVGVRCAGTVREERSKHTWESLLLTPLRIDEIMSAKLWGVLGAAWPHLLLYLLPTLALSLMGGAQGAAVLGFFIALAFVGMFLSAGIGIACSGWSRPLYPSRRTIRPLPEHRRAAALLSPDLPLQSHADSL